MPPTLNELDLRNTRNKTQLIRRTLDERSAKSILNNTVSIEKVIITKKQFSNAKYYTPECPQVTQIYSDIHDLTNSAIKQEELNALEKFGPRLAQKQNHKININRLNFSGLTNPQFEQESNLTSKYSNVNQLEELMMNSLKLKPDFKADSILINKHERIKSIID